MSQQARDHYDQGVRLFLGAEYGAAEAFEQAVQTDPGFALGHAGHARALMMTGDMPAAKAAIATATELASGNARDASHVAAFAALLSGDPAGARRLVKAHVLDHPRDALVAQMCTNVFGLIGFSGEVGREAELLAYTNALSPHYGNDWWMMSMQALSLCETGQTEASLTLMEVSLALNPRNANASHFKAHAQYEDGDIAAGRAFLDDWMTGYDSRAVLHGHLSWHQALWALHDNDPETMWRAVDAGVAPGAAKGLPINVLTDTAAIYHRAEMAGLTVDADRWQTLSDYAARFFPQTGQSFADMHAALSHAMAGEGDRLAYIAETAQGFAGDLVRLVARSWLAIARQDWALALEGLVTVMGSTERLGGSRAQRDLLELAYVNVLLKLGQTDEARRSLQTRRPVLSPAPPLAAMV
ncbi:MAG: tetratricopeptide repeat protein [Marinomonas sp.]